MRTVHGVKVRALTRKEVKSLKKYGFYLSYYSPDGDIMAEQVDEGFEAAVEYGVVDKDAFEKLEDESLSKTSDVFFGILKETYGAGGEEKNSPMSGNGSQTNGE